MIWVVALLVVVNILLLFVIGFVTYNLIQAKAESEIYLDNWNKWERRWWGAVDIVRSKTGYHLKIDGLPSEMDLIKKD